MLNRTKELMNLGFKKIAIPYQVLRPNSCINLTNFLISEGYILLWPHRMTVQIKAGENAETKVKEPSYIYMLTVNASPANNNSQD